MSSREEIWETHPSISHYTSVKAALNILESENLRASHYESVEDTKEIIQAKEYLIPAFKLKFGKNTKDSEYEIDKILYEALGRNIYLLAFSKMPSKCNLGDINGLLSMWRYYAKDEGCYIEFDTRLVYNNKTDIYSAFIMDEVSYDQDNNFKDLASRIAIRYGNYLKQQLSDEGFREFVQEFLQIVILSKHPAFQDEREIRIGVALEKQAFSMHNSPPSYIEWPFDPSAVKRIVVGPSVEQVDNVVRLRSYISGSREYEHVSIEKAKLPIRMHQK